MELYSDVSDILSQHGYRRDLIGSSVISDLELWRYDDKSCVLHVMEQHGFLVVTECFVQFTPQTSTLYNAIADNAL